MRKYVFSVCILLAVAASASAVVEAPNGPAKYVFFMIGDGMASVQIHAAEAYLASVGANDIDDGGLNKSTDLAMNSELGYVGLQKTWAWNQLITDSAAAGTALACGHKSYAGAISVDPEDPNLAYKTLAELAKEQGKKVGILSSVSLDHATPAVFYAHEVSRNNYGNIGFQGATNGTVDFFGGGTFKDSKWADPSSMWPTFEANGYTIVHDLTDLQNLPVGTKCVAASSVTQDSQAMHYEIDRINSGANGEWSLAEVTEEAIRILDNEKGFFMMVEGGKIDWTCHANDALTSIYDTIAFDDACRVVIEFAKAHPGECLIVVTADHETGGLTQGWAGTKYDSAYQNLTTQTMSFQAFGRWLSDYQSNPYSFYNIVKIVLSYLEPDADLTRVINLIDDLDMQNKIEETFGVVYNDLSALQQAQLEEAYDRQMTGEKIRGSEEDYLIYGDYNPLAIACTHIINARAGLGWTSYSHTAVPVPVMANDPSFSGYYDNTDVAKKIAAAMGGSLN
ncbi:MAG: alkaline phosphatase [Sedimentisphaerales bacterium]|nr:alkaline phosphatase [Sedimentisphaerales bacterium]